MIMTAHLNFPALDDSGNPATLSKPIMTGVLRGELGYKGVIVTDSLAMQGVRDLYGDAEVAVRALLAGVDQLLMTPAMDDAYAAVLGAVRSGRIAPSELDAKVRRVLELKYRRGIVAQPVRRPGRRSTRRRHPGAPRRGRRRSPTARRPSSRTTPGALPIATERQEGPRHRLRRRRRPRPSPTALPPRGPVTTVKQTGTSPTDAQVAAAVAAAADQDAVVVTTMKAWDTTVTDPRGGQQKLVKQLLATGKPVVVVAVRDPYDIAYFTAAPTYLATYSYSPVAIEAAGPRDRR